MNHIANQCYAYYGKREILIMTDEKSIFTLIVFFHIWVYLIPQATLFGTATL